MAWLFENASETGDVFIKTNGGRGLRCHRGVLAARSPVFRAMLLEHKDTKEARDGRVLIKETTPESMEAFLDLLATGWSDKLDQHSR